MCNFQLTSKIIGLSTGSPTPFQPFVDFLLPALTGLRLAGLSIFLGMRDLGRWLVGNKHGGLSNGGITPPARQIRQIGFK